LAPWIPRPRDRYRVLHTKIALVEPVMANVGKGPAQQLLTTLI
jgi:hypothetical protein